MNNYGLTNALTMSNPRIYASKFVAIFQKNNCIPLDICFSLQETSFPAITPPKHIQTLLFYQL